MVDTGGVVIGDRVAGVVVGGRLVDTIVMSSVPKVSRPFAMLGIWVGLAVG